jgi:hypothetical protein
VFRCACREEWERDGKWGSLGFRGSGEHLIGAGGRRRESWRTASDGVPTPSCFPDREVEDDDVPGGSRLSALIEPVSWPGPKWVGLLGRGGGLRPDNSLLSYFFSLCFFYFCFIYWFQVIYLNSNIFAGFWIRATFEMNFYV